MRSIEKIGFVGVIAVAVGAASCSIFSVSKGRQEMRQPASSTGYTGMDREEVSLTPEEKAGREIWYKATAGDKRFYTYVLPQKLGANAVQWGRFLDTNERDHRFNNWGMINDPDCCTPGSKGCPAKSLEETYGFDWCPGDEELLKFVGRETIGGQKYRDPACDFKDPNSAKNDREDPCHLEFGTSTGALGFRKFPNPRFDAAAWKKLNGSLGSWAGYGKRTADGSIEPPYLIGTTCGSCHIAFNPASPPKNPNHPDWTNILGTVGNQFIRSAIFYGSGTPENSLEWQMFRHERPGATDTSAFPNDFISNPGTMNAIINLPQRPQFMETVKSWRKVASCNTSDSNRCWCDPEHAGKCWEKSEKTEKVFHILKGGEDTIGAAGAVQRVYINIGSCSEQCWTNHLADMRVFDPAQRGYGQTPVDIGQCRRDCASFRAIEDRVGDIFSFLSSARPKDLNVAKGVSFEELVDQLGGQEKFEKGRHVFANRCATCHSSQTGNLENADFHAVDPKTGMRRDWMGNDQLTPISAVETFACRALHTNHSPGHVYAEYTSEDFKRRASDPSPEISSYAATGTAHMRNISLLNLWAYAPFLHNNALGPEICSEPTHTEWKYYQSPYQGRGRACVPMDAELVSVEGRYKLFRESMQELLTEPEKRPQKISRTDRDIDYPLLPSAGIYLRIPKGTSVAKLGSFRYKDFLADFTIYLKDRKSFKQKYLIEQRRVDAAMAEKMDEMFSETAEHFLGKKELLLRLVSPKRRVLVANPERLDFYMTAYANCPAGPENAGHRFGTDLSDDEKDALIAFLSTL